MDEAKLGVKAVLAIREKHTRAVPHLLSEARFATATRSDTGNGWINMDNARIC